MSVSSRRRRSQLGIGPRSDVFRVLYECSSFIDVNQFGSELKLCLPSGTLYTAKLTSKTLDTASYDVVFVLPSRHRMVEVKNWFKRFRDGGNLSSVNLPVAYERKKSFLQKHLGQLAGSELSGDLLESLEDYSCTEIDESESSCGDVGFPRKRGSLGNFMQTACGSESPGKRKRYDDIVLQKAEELKRKEVELLRLQLYRLTVRSGSRDGVDDTVRHVCADGLFVESILDEGAKKRESNTELVDETSGELDPFGGMFNFDLTGVEGDMEFFGITDFFVEEGGATTGAMGDEVTRVERSDETSGDSELLDFVQMSNLLCTTTFP